MNKGVKVVGLVLMLIVLSAGISMASFSYKGNNLRTSYSAGERISGTVNISFTSEPANSLVKSNFNGSMKLIDLIRANQLIEGTHYTCTYQGCFDGYSNAGEISGPVILSEGSPLIVGFKLTGENVAVSSIKFSVTSNAGKSCSRPLLIDILDRNETFVQSGESAGEVCETENFGCFNPLLSDDKFAWADITTNQFCERVILGPAPAYRIGGIIRNGTSQSRLIVSILDSEGQSHDCILPELNGSTPQIGCNVDYSISSRGNYFLCIRAEDDAGAGEEAYKIKTESSGTLCGSSSGGSEPYDIDFGLFASPLKFAAAGTLNVNDSALVTYIDDYLEDIYQRNCSLGCTIPFKMIGIAQNLTFSGEGMGYTKGFSALPPTVYADKFYRFNSNISKINTPKPINLEMSFAGLTIPLGSNATKLFLYLNNQAIMAAPLNIVIAPSFGFDIIPKTVLIGAKTKFMALTSANITASAWNFGDGATGAVSGKSISHRYSAVGSGNYTVEVELTRGDGAKARNSFVVGIGSLQLSATSLISEYEALLANLSAQINVMPTSISNAIKAKTNITAMQGSLAAVKRTLANASSDTDYLAVINQALAINPPALIAISEEGKSIPLALGIESADTRYIEEISSVTLTDSARSELKKTISSWLDANYDATVEYSVVSSSNDNDVQTPILTYFKVSMAKKAGAGESANPAYLIINYPLGSINFLGNYSAKTVSSGTYIQIDDSRIIEFIVSGSIGMSSLGMYLSPDVNQLTSTEGVTFAETGGFNWGRFIFWMIVLLIIAFCVYIALQEWYKRRYESYLFKNPADLYNAITFIHNSRKNSLDDSEIAKKLKNAGWSGERITYAFRKLDGKRTGMFEIPIFRFFEQRKILKEIEKRRAEQQTKPLLK